MPQPWLKKEKYFVEKIFRENVDKSINIHIFPLKMSLMRLKKQYHKYVKIFFLKSKDEWINLFWSSPPCDYIDLIFGIDLGPTSPLLGFWSPAFNGFYWISANMKRNIFADVDVLFPSKLLGTLQSIFSCCLLTGEEDLINRICLIPHKGRSDLSWRVSSDQSTKIIHTERKFLNRLRVFKC